MQQIALEFPSYGYRRITMELNRRGFPVNHKRVLRLMRADHLLCLRRKAFLVTTDSRHNLPVYPNLAGDIEPDGVNQLWRADITCLRLRNDLVYLAVVLDAYSRRVIGWALGRTLQAGLAVSAPPMTLRHGLESDLFVIAQAPEDPVHGGVNDPQRRGIGVSEIEKLVPVRKVQQPRPDPVEACLRASREEVRADAGCRLLARLSKTFVFHALAKSSALPRKFFSRRTIHQMLA